MKIHVNKYTIYKYIPHIVWTLLISLGYAFLETKVDELLAMGNGVELYYIQGLFFIFPLIIFKIGMKKLKNIGQFIFLGLFVSVAFYIITGSILFVVITVFLWVIRFSNRLQGMEGSLDDTHFTLLLAIVAYILLCGVTEDIFLQKMAIYHLIIGSLLSFSFHGLCRFEEYIRIRHEKANMPRNRILDTGIKIFFIVSILMLLWMIPVIQYQYEFFAITMPEFEAVMLEEEVYEQEEQQQGGMDLSELVGGEQEDSKLKVLWEILEKIMIVVFYGALIYIIVRAVYKIIVTFNQVQFEKNDTIESSVDVNDEILKREIRKKKWYEFFDFSEDMKIRRRYKKELKKHGPKHWQTPAEMEEMANLEIEELHDLYEKVRYGTKKK
ncbi:MAG: hypothetical protein R3Y24_03840 [Eubacteriales bacterium]